MQSYHLRFFAVLLLAICTLIACEKDPLELPDLPELPIEDASAQIQGLVMSDSVACYDIAYPITFVFEDGNTQTANDDSELFEVLESDPEPINLVYPVNLIDVATGITQTANDEEELIALLSLCEFDIEYTDSLFFLPEGSCWEIIYPVSFELADSTTLTIDDEDDYFDLIDPTNPPVDFVYPVTVEVEDEEDDAYTLQVFSAAELWELEELCEDDDDDDPTTPGIVVLFNGYALPHDSIPACYSYVYPITITSTTNGNTESYVLNNDSDWDNIAPDVLAPFDFEYPFEVTELGSGEILEIDEVEEVMEAIDECGIFGTPLPELFVFVSADLDSLTGPDCYDFVYPVSVITNTGDQLTVNEDSDWNPIIFGDGIDDFIYPFDVTVTDSGETETVENYEDMEELLEECPG